MFYPNDKRTFLAVFRHALVAGHPGVVVSGCRLFMTSHRHMLPMHSLLDNRVDDLTEPMPVLETAISCVHMSCDNYYHWTLDCLPRLVVALQALNSSEPFRDGDLPHSNRSLATTVHILLPSVPQGFIHAALDRLGIDRGRRRQHDPFSPVRVGHLIVVDWSPSTRPGLELSPSKAALELARRRLAPASLQPRPRDAVIFISRNTDKLSGTGSRTAANEAAFVQALANLTTVAGLRLEVFQGDRTSLAETIALFGEARAVIGVHGAGLANMLFAPPGTKVFEIALRTPRHRDYMHAAAALGHEYWIVQVCLNALESQVELDIGAMQRAFQLAFPTPAPQS